MSDETYRGRLADLNAMTATLDALNQSSGKAAANNLIKAHEHLVKAVNAYQPDLSDLVKALGDLKDSVTALQTALTSASTPSKKGS
jgi:ElaB/YqjD/DUF883 family membrane-anchored ribosome-binding protein